MFQVLNFENFWHAWTFKYLQYITECSKDYMDIIHLVDLVHYSSDYILFHMLRHWKTELYWNLKTFLILDTSSHWHVEGKGTLEEGLNVALLFWADNHWSQITQERAQKFTVVYNFIISLLRFFNLFVNIMKNNCYLHAKLQVSQFIWSWFVWKKSEIII